MGDINVFKTPYQNIITAKTLCKTLEPLLADNAKTTPMMAKIKAMVIAAVVQSHQENHLALLSSRATSSQHPSGQEKAAVNLAKVEPLETLSDRYMMLASSSTCGGLKETK